MNKAPESPPPNQCSENGSGVDDVGSQNLPFAEDLLADWLKDPESVPEAWRVYFDRLTAGRRPLEGSRTAPTFARRSLFNPPGEDGRRPSVSTGSAGLQERVDQLIRNYRVRGHIVAAVDPLDSRHPEPPELNPAYYGFTEADLDRPFSTRSMRGPKTQTLRRIIQRMRNTYCRAIGAQFMHIDDLSIREWLQERMEGTENRLALSRDARTIQRPTRHQGHRALPTRPHGGDG